MAIAAGDNHLLETIRSVLLVPLHPAGRPFVAVFAAVTILLFFLWSPLGWAGVVLTLWCIYFFRHPRRTVPTRAGLVVAPADGRVQTVGPAVPPPELGLGPSPRTRISIFLNVFDVHVNRVPVGGVVGAVAYRPGRFLNASLDKASDENERCGVSIGLPDGRIVAMVQIAGLVARRIVCELRGGQPVATGETYGLIRFGSRTDLYLPDGTAPLVAVGQRMVGGETVVADLASAEPARAGEVR
jgi:phosphatidylserine decarboxylase